MRTEFVRLNPGRDAYVRALIDEETSNFHALSSRTPPSSDDTTELSKNPPPGAISQPSIAQEQSLTVQDYATHHAENPEDAPHSFQATNPRAQASEAAARQYIEENFQPTDWLAVLVRNRQTGETIHRMSSAQRIASPESQRWLRYENAHGSDIYLSLNTFKDHVRNRTKADLKKIRHLYLDLDEGGPRKLAAIRTDTAVPAPNYVLNTSPDKYQVIWKVEGIGQEEAETFLRALAQRFGADPAATDSTRVFRLPGFSNKKYEEDFLVTLTKEAPPSLVYQPSDFNVQVLPIQPERTRTSSTGSRFLHEGESNSQSEKD